MPATVRVTYFNGAGPTLNDATAGVKFGLEDDNAGTNPITIPTSTGTNYSWYKLLGLEATALATPATTITNRRVQLATTETAGLAIFYLTTHPSAYTQATSGNKPADNGTTAGPATPASYTRLTTTPVTYDAANVVTVLSAVNGKYVQLVFGVDNSFAGGAGTNTPLPNFTFTYDEF
jgi:hypothetical protein